MFVATPTVPGTKEQPAGAGYAPVYVPYPTGGAWVAPGYGAVQPAWGGPRVVVGPDGSVLVEIAETPPMNAPIPVTAPQSEESGNKSGGLLMLAALAAFFFS